MVTTRLALATGPPMEIVGAPILRRANPVPVEDGGWSEDVEAVDPAEVTLDLGLTTPLSFETPPAIEIVVDYSIKSSMS